MAANTTTTVPTTIDGVDLTALLATRKGESVDDRKARIDEVWTVSKAVRQAVMSANGIRKAREARGYGRQAMAKALDMSKAEQWTAEWSYTTTQAKDVIKRINALEDVRGKVSLTKEDPSTEDKATAPTVEDLV